MFSYPDAVDFLNSRLPMFSTAGSSALRKGLDNISELCLRMGNPQADIPFIHIAGTNGKGSCSHMIAAALQAAGYKTGLYTSPHLIDLRERIRIDGQPVAESLVVEFVEMTKGWIDEIAPSYFELNVAMAFYAFKEYKVDVAVIETGLGGRWDSTNIIRPVLSVITNIDYDHTQILGETLAAIAGEKAGIIKENVPVVVGQTHPETEQVFFLEAHKKNAPLLFADSLWEIVRSGQDMHFQYCRAFHKGEQSLESFKSDLLGGYQLHNFKTVLAACDILHKMGWQLPRHLVLESLSSVKSATGLRGRWDWVQKYPNIILDVAHNPAGLEYLVHNLKSLEDAEVTQRNSKLFIVCGFVKDKDVSAALEFFPKEATYFFTRANVPRALPVEDLVEIAHARGLEGKGYGSVAEAVLAAREMAGEEDTILITGSFFIVGEAMAGFNSVAESAD